jgi:O-antigen/teichoic acid export membrane protein
MDSPEKSLMARAAHGFAWVFAWRMATRLMGLGSTLILVRLLSPAEFGLVAIAMSFIGSIDQFSQIGVEEALVRMPAPNRTVYDTAFTMIALRCALIAVITAISAWPVAVFFQDSRLVFVMLAIAGVTLIAGLENVGVQDFRRHMRFDQEFLLQAMPRLGGIVATITSAIVWHDFWALIIGTAVTRIGRVVMSYAVHPLRPRFSLAAWRDLIGFSLWTWAICVARVVRDQPTAFIVGRTVGTSGLGMLNVASEIALLPTSEIVYPMGRSMFSAFALARRSGEDVEAIFRRLVGLTAFLTVPASVGLGLLAAPLIHVMLGPAWVDAVPVMQAVSVAAAFSVLGHACHAQFDAFGLLRQDFAVILFGGLVRVALLFALVPGYGLPGAVTAFALSLILEPLAYLTVKSWTLPFSGRALAGVVIRPAFATACMAAAVLALPEPSGGAVTDIILRLASGVTVGAVCYAVVILVLWWVSGRPIGAEADVLMALRKLGRFGLPQSARS